MVVAESNGLEYEGVCGGELEGGREGDVCTWKKHVYSILAKERRRERTSSTH